MAFSRYKSGSEKLAAVQVRLDVDANVDVLEGVDVVDVVDVVDIVDVVDVVDDILRTKFLIQKDFLP